MSGGGARIEGAWEFYAHMDRRWDADPCAPVDYYDQDACLTFPEALRLCCYAADYDRGRAGRHAGHRAPALLGPAGGGASRRPGRWMPCSNAWRGIEHAMSRYMAMMLILAFVLLICTFRQQLGRTCRKCLRPMNVGTTPQS